MENEIAKLRLVLEYGQEPIWMYDREGFVIDVGLPPEWENYKELYNAMIALSDSYDGLFVDNKTEFRYAGFKGTDDKAAFIATAKRFVKLVIEANADKYPLQNDLDIDSL